MVKKTKNEIIKVKVKKSEIATEIITLHEEIIGLAKMALPKAIRIGQLLIEVKKCLPHGDFGIWCTKNLRFTKVTRAKYMQLYRDRAKFKSKPGLLLTDAYRQAEIISPRPNYKQRTLDVVKIKDLTQRIKALATIAEEIRDTKRSDLYRDDYSLCESLLCTALAPPAGYKYIMLEVLIKESLRIILGGKALLTIETFIPTKDWMKKIIKRKPWIDPTQHGYKMKDFLKPKPDFFKIWIVANDLPNWEPDEHDEEAWPAKALTMEHVYISRLYERMRDYIDFRGIEYSIGKHKL